VEAILAQARGTLIRADAPPRTLDPAPQPDIFTAFVRALRGEGSLPLSRYDAFRITEIALRAQEAVDTGRIIALEPSAFASAA
jgi:hypothetical protein